MKIFNSNKSYSMIIAWILVASIASIFVAYVLGVVGHGVYSDHGIQTHGIGFPVQTKNNNRDEFSLENGMLGDNSSISGINDVHVAQSCDVEVDTQKGKIEIVDENYDNVPLPLCVTPDTVKNWWVVVNATGGYKPLKDCNHRIGMIEFWQKNNLGVPELISNCYNPYMKLAYYLKAKEVTADYVDCDNMYDECCCCVTYWNITIDTSCGNWACIDSNDEPDVPGCCIVDPPVDLDKEVTIKINTDWCGCCLQDQQFEIIYAHKS
jgi:hypothetical protein